VETSISFVLFLSDKRDRINRYVKIAARTAAATAAPTAAPAMGPTLVVECWLGLTEVEVSLPKDEALDITLGVLEYNGSSALATSSGEFFDAGTEDAASLDVPDTVTVELWLPRESS
jgi:hypothetical protein